MKTSLEPIRGSVNAPRGFRAAGVFCDIKRLGTGKGSEKGRKRDLALIVSDYPATAAGLFTTNQVCAAPVKLSAARVARGTAQAIVVNSGNANACTGERGKKDALAMTAVAAQCLAVPPDSVLAGSTGRIGVPLPMANVRQGILAAAKLLNSTPENASHAAEAILTSDTHAKEIAFEFTLDGKRVRLGGICKGAGMIQPGMSPSGSRPASTPFHATMLCFLTSDAAVEAGLMRDMLTEAVASSFNRITIDGDMSTNDTVLLLANGQAGNRILTPARRADRSRFQEALNAATLALAKMIVKDGEGVTRFVSVRVSGARTPAQADAAARAVANSPLVKTSWCGGDPNWGRILAALGYSSADIQENKIDLAYGAPGSRRLVYSLRQGRPTAVSFGTLCRVVAEKEFDLHIDLHLGKGSAVVYASDLTEAYVEFNKGNVSDPSSLGG